MSALNTKRRSQKGATSDLTEDTFEEVEKNLTSTLDNLTTYFEINHLKANPQKTQVCAFHLRNHVAKRPLKISWSGTSLEHCPNPIYLGVTLDRSLSYKQHIEKTKAKTNTRNNILRKLVSTTWGAKPPLLRTSALALSYSTAEYACPVWERSAHAKKLDPTLNDTCRLITGCLKPTNTTNLHILAGIAPPNIRREVASRNERQKQSTDERHLVFGKTAAKQRLKSRKSFLSHTITPTATASAERVSLWKTEIQKAPPTHNMKIPPSESLPKGKDETWPKWKCLNRLRSRVGRTRVEMQRWGYSTDPTNCDCGTAPQDTTHLLICPLLPNPCTTEDLAEYNTQAQECVKKWLAHV
ncbi:hypothetical protein SKAU_G00109130 [Synaphobranchus kaupii]|uniref:Uncharacterized protein n=1 Tax=Synaphobranchus kaupii TaxID=118154 RepID=A0A9Q1G0W8_SYNKA|nr:hypothetical protein SKAU_G00109130 [Synaphobranchus kaupii]